VIGVTELTQSPPSRVDRAIAALGLAEDAIASHDVERMRRAVLVLKQARGDLRFARMTAPLPTGNTSRARLEVLEQRIQADIERIREYT
jgi:hypothetical protein